MGNVDWELEQFRGALVTQIERRSELQDDLRANGEVGPPGNDTLTTQTLDVLDRWLNDAETVCGELASQYGLDSQLDSPFTSPNIKRTPPDLVRLSDLLSQHKTEAKTCMKHQQYRQAEYHLVRALYYYHGRGEQQPMTLQELVDLTNDLAVMQQKQHKWIESISECRRLLDLISGCNPQTFVPEPNEQALQSMRARSLYSLADILYERYKQSEQAADLEQAQSLANEARNTYDNLQRHLCKLDDIDKGYKITCLKLLISIYGALRMKLEAREAHEALKRLSFVLLPPHQTATVADGSSLGDPGSDVHKQLIKAIMSGNQDCLQNFLPYKGLIDLDKYCSSECCSNSRTPLMHAVAAPCGQLGLVNQLLGPEWEADPNGRGEKDTTALHVAMEEDMPDIAEILIQHGADLEAKDSEGETPLMRATQLCRNAMVDKLLDHGAKIPKPSKDEWSLLHRAVHSCSAAIVTRLLDADHDVLLAHHTDRYGKTALHLCVDGLKIKHAKSILAHPNSQGILNLPDAAARTALCHVMDKTPNPKRLEFAQTLYNYDQAALQYCVGADYYQRYEKQLRTGQRRDSISTNTTRKSSSSEDPAPSGKKRSWWSRKSSSASRKDQ